MKIVTPSSFLAIVVATTTTKNCDSFSISSLTPRTTPEEIVSAQLSALKDDDMKGVFDFASPSNKANVNNDLTVFDSMVRKGPYYKYLIGHEESAVLLTTTMTTTTTPSSEDVVWQGLVRIVPAASSTATTNKGGNDDINDDYELLMSDNKQSKDEPTKEYWWTLSRCQTGLYKDCYMVDAVMPNK